MRLGWTKSASGRWETSPGLHPDAGWVLKAGLLAMNGKGLSDGALQVEYFVFEELD